MRASEIEALRSGLFYTVKAKGRTGKVTERKMRFSHVNDVGQLVFQQPVKRHQEVYQWYAPNWIESKVWPGAVLNVSDVE